MLTSKTRDDVVIKSYLSISFTIEVWHIPSVLFIIIIVCVGTVVGGRDTLRVGGNWCSVVEVHSTVGDLQALLYVRTKSFKENNQQFKQKVAHQSRNWWDLLVQTFFTLKYELLLIYLSSGSQTGFLWDTTAPGGTNTNHPDQQDQQDNKDNCTSNTWGKKGKLNK